MLLRSLPAAFAAIACGLLAGATPALAAPIQTWVSQTTGNDSGACPVTAPCKTFAWAYAQTGNNGVINVLTSGDYGPLTITRSVSIESDGAVAAIYMGNGGDAIRINGTGIDVSLRGLTIDIFGTPGIGISFINGAALHVTNCTIRGAVNGIRFAPSTPGTSELYVSDTVITKGPSDGLAVAPLGGAYAKVMIERVRVENTGNDGIMFSGVNGSINATVRETVTSGNDSSGITAASNPLHPVNIMLNRIASINNGNIGIVANCSQIRIGDSVVSGNYLGLSTTNSGSIWSYGNNQVNANFTGGDGLMTGPVPFK